MQQVTGSLLVLQFQVGCMEHGCETASTTMHEAGMGFHSTLGLRIPLWKLGRGHGPGLHGWTCRYSNCLVQYSNVHTGNAGSSPCFVTSSVKCGGFCWKHTSNKALYPPSLLFHYSLPGYCTGTVQTPYCIYCIHTNVVLTYDTTRHLPPSTAH